MNIITVGGQYLNNAYSSDFLSTSGDYIDYFTPVVANYEFPPVFIGYAPNTVLEFSPDPGTNYNGVSSLSFNFGDIDNPAPVVISFTDFSNNGIQHEYGTAGYYQVFVTLIGGMGGTFHIADLSLQDITSQINISVFNQDGTTFVGSSAVSPATLQFCTSGTFAGSYPIESLIWDFGDGTQHITIDRYSNTTNNKVLFYPEDPSDPRNYIVSHVYNRKTLQNLDTFTTTVSAISKTTGNVSIAVSNPLGPFKLSNFGTRKLIKNRMFDSNDTIILILEDETNRTTCQYMVSAF